MSLSPFVVLVSLTTLVAVGCASDDRCELTATCPMDPDSGMREGGLVADEGVSDDAVSDEGADDGSDDVPGLGTGPSRDTDAGADVPNSPGGSLTILPPGPSAPADCAAPNCPDGGASIDPSDASATDSVDGSVPECMGESCDGGCHGDDCEMGCTPGTFDSTNFDEACFQ